MSEQISTAVSAPTPRSRSNTAAVPYGITLLANVIRSGFSFLAGLVVARALGAGSYGDLTFLLGSFVAVSQLLDSPRVWEARNEFSRQVFDRDPAWLRTWTDFIETVIAS